MPLRLDEEARHQFFDAYQQPGPLLDLLGTAAFRAATAAMGLGFFRALAEAPLSGEELASRCQTDPTASVILLDTLESFGYIRREQDLYHLTAMAKRWMVTPVDQEDSEAFDFTLVKRFWALLLFQLWDDLEGTVRRGHPNLDLYHWLDQRPEAQRTFQAMLGQLAKLNGGEIVSALALDPEQINQPLRLLDLGAGHGRHALTFLQRVPGAHATLVDSQSAMTIARENAQKLGLDERCAFIAADFREKDFPEGSFDVVFLFSIVHSFDVPANVELLSRVRRFLAPGGTLIVLEQLSDTKAAALPEVADAFHRTFRLNLFHLLGGRTYSLSEVCSWLEQAGLEFQRKVDLQSTGDSLVIATRPR